MKLGQKIILILICGTFLAFLFTILSAWLIMIFTFPEWFMIPIIFILIILVTFLIYILKRIYDQ